MFDTIGTLVGTASRAGMVDKDGNMPKMKEALLSDAIGTVAGACTGTSTVTTFVESASGVEAGGRTGLTALTTGVLFLACIFIAPIAAIIPAAATSSALIYVGVLMLMGLKNVNFDDLDQMVPVSLMLIAMPISSSIGHAIGIGLISYTVIKVFTGKAKDVSALTYVISVLFLIKLLAFGSFSIRTGFDFFGNCHPIRHEGHSEAHPGNDGNGLDPVWDRVFLHGPVFPSICQQLPGRAGVILPPEGERCHRPRRAGEMWQ